MGHKSSKLAIDGLGNPTPLPTPPLEESRVKVDQLLLALSSNYQFNSLGERLVNEYFLGATPAELIKTFDTEAAKLPKWVQDDPEADSVCEDNIREFANDVQYQERYYDFFRDQLTESTEWESVVAQFQDLIFDGLFRYEARALIHLACAAEINHPVMAMEALGMAAWATPDEPSPPVRQGADLRVVLQRALNRGFTAARAAAAVCELTMGRNYLPPRKLVDRLAYELQHFPESDADWTRARFILEACLSKLGC
ncbi:hypothetical protein B9G98_03064 [Wickerhamiella sorbophila]|uniref:Uncharacterized protein n=1 Tax=Wickerhamiella sorbophila TaxID=45607 RepID=A0A2T0FKB9_9ASCO|nr:hypothetical protein B9G98_03064 [Wickerhamiella sorbophila]PRT55444.1 hypothetical protein B9G98_03064 [Wickerhamiella sorbophila]